jgi:hypothetical protein
LDGNLMAKPNFDEYKKVHEEALTRFKRAVDAENDNREAAEDDIEWLLGNQWDEKTKRARRKRPTLTVNRLNDFKRRTVNEIRKNRPAIKVGAADSEASDEVAAIMGGMIRAIERNSHADIAYDTAVDQAVGNGFGHFRVITEYVDAESFLQEIRIERIANQFSVYTDPECQQPGGEDATWRFVTEMFDADTFEAKHGFKPASLKEVGAVGDEAELWWDGDRVRVAEYWRIVEKPVTIYLMPDGKVTRGSGDEKKDIEKMAAAGVMPQHSRTTKMPVVECYMMTGEGCFKKQDYKGRFIPIVSVIGEEVIKGDKRVLKSLIRDAKDAQKMLNYWKSTETELLASQPKAPVWLPRGSIDDPSIRKKWDSANTESWPYLEFDVVAGMGPQRQQPPTFPTAARDGANGSIEDMKAIMGIQDPTLGKQGNEVSGVAIFERKLQGDVSTFHFVDNLARAIRQCGTIIVDLIPHVYDTERIVRVLGEDGKTEQKVKVNGPTIVNGKERTFKFDSGKYDVSVSSGPSFTTQREEAARYQMALMQANPAMGQVIGDVIVKNMEWPQADEMAARIRKSLPPHITGDAPHPQVQQQMQQLQQQLQQGKQMLDQLQEQNAALKDYIRAAEFDVKKAQAQAQAVERKAAGDFAVKYIDAISKRITALATMMEAKQSQVDGITDLVAEVRGIADSIAAGVPLDGDREPPEAHALQ